MGNKYRTRVIVVVHSHMHPTGGIDISADVIAVNTSKSVKGAGTFNFVLVPRRNYLNYIFPDDVVNIYFDPGDNERGFVRTMMGYVDRIERMESTDDTGATSTQFQVSGTDFVKALDHTQIVFNPALAARQELLDARFGKNNLFGNALASRGIQIFGTPAQFVENSLILLMGYVAQWALPKSYGLTDLNNVRKKRMQRYKNTMPDDLLLAITTATGINMAGDLIDAKFLEENLAIETQKIDDLSNLRNANDAGRKEFKTKIKDANTAILYGNVERLTALQTLAKEVNDNSPASIMDLISFDFIETLCIDGFTISRGLWEKEGTVASIVYAYSNEPINELIFDLRAVADNGPDNCMGVSYSKEPDEVAGGINVNGTEDFPASVSAVKYIPAVIMREYPHSTVKGIDMSEFFISNTQTVRNSKTGKTETVKGEEVGIVEFGDIFALEPGIPGRKLCRLDQALIPNPCDSTGVPQKHLDVVVISGADVKSSQIGRTDQFITNFVEFFNTQVNDTVQAYDIGDFSPLLSGVSIKQHGIRRHKFESIYNNYGHNVECIPGKTSHNQTATRAQRIRWILMRDHWDQHNVEYLNGTIELRGMPEIRVGYRLDWEGRNESYYVEAVSHTWSYPGAMGTTVQVTRGQRNDPFLAYIPPTVTKFSGSDEGNPDVDDTVPDVMKFSFKVSSFAKQGGGNRIVGPADQGEKSRLADFFTVRDTDATARAIGAVAQTSETNEMDTPPNADRGGVAIYPNNAIPLVNEPATTQVLTAATVPTPNVFAKADKSLTALEESIQRLTDLKKPIL